MVIEGTLSYVTEGCFRHVRMFCSTMIQKISDIGWIFCQIFCVHSLATFLVNFGLTPANFFLKLIQNYCSFSGLQKALIIQAYLGATIFKKYLKAKGRVII